MARRNALKVLAAVAWGVAMLAPVQAMPPSCQADYEKYGKAREDAVQRVNSFNKRRPTATQACGAFNTLTGAEAKMLEWMSTNKDWCQIPDAFLEQFKQSSEQTQKVRGQVCTAAKKEQQMRRQAQQNAAPRGPQVGGGVRLPQGAL